MDKEVKRNLRTEAPPSWWRLPTFHLFVTLLLTFVTHPIAARLYQDSAHAHLMPDIFLCFIIVFAARSVTSRMGPLWIVIGISVLGFGIRRFNFVSEVDFAVLLSWLLLLLPMTVILLVEISRPGHVDAKRLFGAASIYLLIGIWWGMLFAVYYEMNPEAFNVPDSLGEIPRAHLMQFSFTTLTTVGYGDITPRSLLARMLANLEAILGQLFLVFVVARLVALQIVDTKKS